MKKFIHCMYENNLFIKDGIIYDTKDGCIKQYRCANRICILSILVFTHRVIIDKLVHVPGHSRSKIYGINGVNKTYLKQKLHHRH